MSHDEDDITVEPIRGLPGHLPDGEKILWQGAPSTWALARESLALRWVIGYFLLLAALRTASLWGAEPPALALAAGMPFVFIGAGVSALLVLFAWTQARNSVYTITSERVVFRVGAAITMSVNLPYAWVESADLLLRRDGTGSIFLKTKGNAQLAYLGLWPHVRPWRMKQTEPALRAIPDAARVARILGEAAETRVNQPELTRADIPAAVPAE